MPKKHRDKDTEVILTDNKLKDKIDNIIHKAEIVDRIDTLPFSDNYKTGRLDNGDTHTPSTDPSLLASVLDHSAPGEWHKEDEGSPLEKKALLPPILQDLEVPTKKSGPWKSSIDKERWRNVCETLLSRNIKNAYQISKLTGLTNASALAFVKEIRESWQSDLTPQRVNIRREKLYSENERISEFCWAMIQADPTSRDVPQYLKIVGDTNTRRARLIGAENITIQSKVEEVKQLDAHELSISTAKKLGVSVEVLKQLGDDLSGNMSDDDNT